MSAFSENIDRAINQGALSSGENLLGFRIDIDCALGQENSIFNEVSVLGELLRSELD